jgi:hypothetical protein
MVKPMIWGTPMLGTVQVGMISHKAAWQAAEADAERRIECFGGKCVLSVAEKVAVSFGLKKSLSFGIRILFGDVRKPSVNGS